MMPEIIKIGLNFLPVLSVDLDSAQSSDHIQPDERACSGSPDTPCHTCHHTSQCQSDASQSDILTHLPLEFLRKRLDLESDIIIGF
jgi:hypothetical protein